MTLTKKLLSFILSLALFPIAGKMPLTVSAEDCVLFSDNFESYSLTEKISGASGTAKTIIDGYWETSAVLGGDTYNTYAVDYDMRYANGYDTYDVPTNNKTLALTPSDKSGGASAAANLIFDTGTPANYTFSADVRISYHWSQTPVSGIRLYNPEKETDYYELALLTPQEPDNYVYQQYEEAKKNSLAPRFTKVQDAKDNTSAIKKDADIPDQWLVTAYSPEKAVTMLHFAKDLDSPDNVKLRTTWHTLSITKLDNIICWKIFDKERDKTVWEASYTDESPLFDGMGALSLFIYGNGANNTVNFDNVTLTEIDSATFKVPKAATLTEKAEPTPAPEKPSDKTPDTPLYLLKDDVEGYGIYVPNGTKAQDITNGVSSYATGYGGNVSDVMVEGYWATSAILGGEDWFNDYCVQYDEISGNCWDKGIVSPIRYSNSRPDTSNKVIALQPSYNELGQLCVLNLAKNLGTDDDFIYSVDVRNFFGGTVNPAAGIRIADPTDDTSYYELAILSKGEIYNVTHEGAKFEKPRFTKVKGGKTHTPALTANPPAEWKYVDYGNVGTASGLYNDNGFKTSWFTLTLGKKGNTLYWKIYDKAFDEVVWEDSFTDSTPLFDGLGRLQLFAYGAGKVQAPTFFDNIDGKKLGVKLFNYEEIADTILIDMTENDINTAPSEFSSSDTSFTVLYDKIYCNAWNIDTEADITDNKTLWMKSAGKLNYNGTVCNNYRIDLRNYFNGSTNPVMGIRIINPDNENDYYELAILSGTKDYNTTADAKIYPPRFTKVKGAKGTTPEISDSVPAEVLYLENSAEKIASCLYRDIPIQRPYMTDWFTLELGKDGADITFKITDRKSGAILWNKTWTDPTPLFEGAGKLQLFTYGGTSSVLFDNISGVALGDSGLRIEASWIKETKDAPFMITADYDEKGRLISATETTASKGNTGYFFSPSSLTMPGSLKKLFLWEKNSGKPIFDTMQYQEGDIGRCNVTYPNFSTKAFTISIDDGSAQDAQVMALMKKYGIRGTFNLTGNTSTAYENYIYDGFEAANHTTHIEMYSGAYTYDDCVASIEDAYNTIKAKTGIDSQGIIWPYRAPKDLSFWSDLYNYVSQRYEYARETGETLDFYTPFDWMQWTATAWSDKWRTYTDKFIDAPYTDDLQMLALAGHAFDTPAGETSMADLCEYVFSTVASDSRIWKATNIELCKYIKAAKALEISSKNVYNPSKDVTLYMIIDGENYVAPPQSYAEPVNN